VVEIRNRQIERGGKMLGHMVLLAAMIGQTADESLRKAPVLSEWAKQAQARALAEFQANEHTIKDRVEANYQLENQRLAEKAATVDMATSRLLYFAGGARSEVFLMGGRTSGFSSIPPTAPSTVRASQDQPSLSELKQANFLIKGRLRDSRYLYREANRAYLAEYEIRYRLARRGQR
jgi:hypothetical protein